MPDPEGAVGAGAARDGRKDAEGADVPSSGRGETTTAVSVSTPARRPERTAAVASPSASVVRLHRTTVPRP